MRSPTSEERLLLATGRFTGEGLRHMITQRKKKAQERLPELLADKGDLADASHEAQIKALHAKIGQLAVENDSLSKAFGC